MLMKLSFILFLSSSLIFFSLTGCRKQSGNGVSGPTTVEGQIVDAVTGKPIYPCWAFLMQEDKDFTAWGRKQINQMQVDVEGRFSFSFDANEENYYTVCGGESKYYFTAGSLCETIKKGGNSSNVKVKLNPKSYVKFSVINQGTKDYADIYLNGNYKLELMNLNKDTVVYDEVPSRQNEIVWVVRKNGVDEKKVETVSSLPLDTVTVTVAY
jgi:hypothetical protein